MLRSCLGPNTGRIRFSPPMLPLCSLRSFALSSNISYNVSPSDSCLLFVICHLGNDNCCETIVNAGIWRTDDMAHIKYLTSECSGSHDFFIEGGRLKIFVLVLEVDPYLTGDCPQHHIEHIHQDFQSTIAKSFHWCFFWSCIIVNRENIMIEKSLK